MLNVACGIVHIVICNEYLFVYLTDSRECRHFTLVCLFLGDTVCHLYEISAISFLRQKIDLLSVIIINGDIISKSILNGTNRQPLNKILLKKGICNHNRQNDNHNGRHCRGVLRNPSLHCCKRSRRDISVR